MPLGLNRTDLNLTGISFMHGTPLVLPPNFEADNEPSFPGNIVDWLPTPAHFGNPVVLPWQFGNPVTWAINPAEFGNIIGQLFGDFLLLVDDTPILLIDNTEILIFN